MKDFIIAQFSDCHLFSDVESLHHGANVYQNLLKVLNDIKSNHLIDIAIFTGDLSQDHSHASYQLFNELVRESGIAIPVYYLAGNHDDQSMLEQYLVNAPLCTNKLIDTPHWSVALLNSKSDTPAGLVDSASLEKIQSVNNLGKHVLLCMHHHPVDVGYGIDKHGLNNKTEFWQHINDNKNVKAVVCGHVHHAMKLVKSLDERDIIIYTCPATSVEFDKTSDSVQITSQGPGYQLLTLSPEGTISSKLKYFFPNFILKSDLST